MNAKQYEVYKRAVEHNLRSLEHVSTGPCPGCVECGLGPRGCEDCEGTGKTIDETPCPFCEGKGEVIPDMDSLEYQLAHADGEGFSWGSCDACGSRLGGDRYQAHGFTKDGGLVHLSICVDCQYYLEYGQLDDMSMLEIEESKDEN